MAFFVFLAASVLAATAVHVAGQQGDQSGFLSIDCGLDAAVNGRRDTNTGIAYVSDSPYIDGGENHKIAADQANTAHDISELTLRSFPFPPGTRTCYTLPTKSGLKYLVRMVFLYGNYDGKTNPTFEVHLGSNYWDTYNNSDYWWSDAVFIAWASWVPVCLVNTGGGTPFVNTVELRPLQASLYDPHVTADQSISAYSRISMGSNTTTRFPDDPYDRLWERMTTNRSLWTYLSTEKTIQLEYNFAVPSAVLKTAIAPANNNTVLNVLTWKSYVSSFQVMVVLHFADFQNSQRRQFNVYINDMPLYFAPNNEGQYSPPYLAASWVYNINWYNATDSKLNVTLAATNISVLPPMINAYEILNLIPHDTPRTSSEDFLLFLALSL